MDAEKSPDCGKLYYTEDVLRCLKKTVREIRSDSKVHVVEVFSNQCLLKFLKNVIAFIFRSHLKHDTSGTDESTKFIFPFGLK